MKLPEKFLQSLEGVAGFDKEAFIEVHEKAEPVTSIRINREKSIVNSEWLIGVSVTSESHSPFTIDYSPVPWCATGYYLSSRPSFTFDPLFHAGHYYVQEASSMFVEQAFSQLLDLSQPLKVLDLCAAPGGKSTHIQSLISAESLVVSNEIIKPRSIVLTDNIIKWGCSNGFVTNNEPAVFKNLPGYFDVLVVDAPCSGSGLFRKDVSAIEEWSLYNVSLCNQRQQRILAHALPALKEGGLLVYATCSYSAEEDEQIADWLVEEHELESLSLKITYKGIVQTFAPKTGAIGYRFYPDKVKGEGFFLSCFHKKSNEESIIWKASKPQTISAKEKEIVSRWVKPGDLHFFYQRDEITALPKNLMPFFLELRPHLNIQYAGTTIGTIIKEKLIPHHALSQSNLLSATVSLLELSYEEAIKYLQRQELSVRPVTTGWQVVHYKNAMLGWINALSNRNNNYFPKALRILKQQNTTSFEKLDSYL
jgi:16S rRNA C967 or C1407 C5-methylase (RsmB/RsmF family)/NOL1/NOP2/fmu family ribosome biogenesis protein